MNTILKSVISRPCFRPQKRHITQSPVLSYFWERNDKSGYRDKRVLPPLTQRLQDGIKELKKEIALWKSEVKEHFENDILWVYRKGEVDVWWKFDKEECLEKWVLTTDNDNNEGYSRCSLVLSNHNKALFSGEISKKVPKDGSVKRAGYCNMKTVRARKSFKRETYLNWSCYNTLVMRIRGDGRSYLLNINTRGYYDITWNDTYSFVLFTRGGPHWQIAKIPFSKFYMSSKGRIQDRQFPIPLDMVNAFGITAAEPYPGEFSLEIDYIGLEFDPNHVEEFAYEEYEVDKYIAQT